MARLLAYAGAFAGAILFVDRIVAGVVQCSSAASCPW
jgi:hypothetical protein